MYRSRKPAWGNSSRVRIPPSPHMILASLIFIILSAIWLTIFGILMIKNPQTAAIYIGKFASTNFINYTEIILRCLWGISCILVSEFSKFPEIFYYFGIILVVTSVILFFVPRKYHSKYAVWWAARISPPYMRIAGFVSILFGIMLIYGIV